MTSAPLTRDSAPGAAQGSPAFQLEGFAGRQPWRRVAEGGCEGWVTGYARGLDDRRLLTRLASAAAAPQAVAAILAELDGHWALALRAGGHVIAAVDRLRSWPLLIDRRAGRATVAPAIAEGLAAADVDPVQALACAMSGYTIGATTLYRDIRTLGPGAFLVAPPDGAPVYDTYHRFRPWLDAAAHGPPIRKQLAETTLSILQGTIDGLDGRQVVAPLSAGRDSRLIVSGLHHLGYRNILCVAYGRPANRELVPSRSIAERLGLPWRFVPLTYASQRSHFAGSLHRRFVAYADALDATPFLQDLPVMAQLQDRSAIDRDAVVINGQAGDFISGNHIPQAIAAAGSDLDPERARRLVVEQALAKHYRLWDVLATPGNDALVGDLLNAVIDPEAMTVGSAAGAAEALEFQNRQVKYVAAGQRCYDFLGLDWRLPLWDRSYMDFWERVPLSAKRGQRLFAEMLEAENWGGVWRDIPVNPPTGMAPWLRSLRFALKAAHAPLGRTRWKAFERRYLGYWMDALANQAAVSYRRVARDRRGARGALAWYAEFYLARHGLRFDGSIEIGL